MYMSCRCLFLFFRLICSGSPVSMHSVVSLSLSLHPTPMGHWPQSPLTSLLSFRSYKFYRSNRADRLLYTIRREPFRHEESDNVTCHNNCQCQNAAGVSDERWVREIALHTHHRWGDHDSRYSEFMKRQQGSVKPCERMRTSKWE